MTSERYSVIRDYGPSGFLKGRYVVYDNKEERVLSRHETAQKARDERRRLLRK